MKTKSVKKIIALVLALTMIMGLSLTTFAATPSGDDLTVPVLIEIVDHPGSLDGTILYNDDVTIDLDTISDPTAMDFIDATGLTIVKTGGDDYIYSISGVANYDEIVESHHYKGYSWMISFLSGSSVTSFGTVPSWASVPGTNSWFSSTLAATNVYVRGVRNFYFNYPSTADGFATSVEGIKVQYVLTDITWD